MAQKNFNIAVVGATGAVGQEILRVLERRGFPVGECRLLASERSVGKQLEFHGKPVSVRLLAEDAFDGIDIAFFSAGATRSREFVPAARAAGAVVIDNSSAFRMDDGVPLVIPEVNAGDIGDGCSLIANPNCCAAILAVAVWPIHQRAGVKRISVATYQSASGAGAQAMEELKTQVRDYAAGNEIKPEVFPFPIAFNVFSHNSAVAENGFNDEENKLVQEMKKIFHAPAMDIIPTCIRVPVLRAHSEAVVLDLEEPLEASEARSLLDQAAGVRVVDDVAQGHFPMPIEATGELDVLVGRIRNAGSEARSLAFFVSGDQLLKGAAWNAVQIAEHCISM
jgi:aspartate-semialdehyde dehydrogenase